MANPRETGKQPTQPGVNPEISLNTRPNVAQQLNERISSTVHQSVELARTFSPRLKEVTVLLDLPESDQRLQGTTGRFRILRHKIDNSLLYQLIIATTAEPYERFVSERPAVMEHEAQLLGIDPQTYVSHLELSVAFTTFHEIGHAKELFDEYLAKGKTTQEYAERDKKIDELLPISSMLPSTLILLSKNERENEKELQPVYTYMREHGITSIEEVIRIQDKAYKQLPDEVYADRFATECMKQFWNQLGFDKFAHPAIS